MKTNENFQKIDEIFLTAMDLFREDGYEKTSIRTLAKKANVSLGLVNHYFESKRKLASCVLETLIQYVMKKTEIFVKEHALDSDELLYDCLATKTVNIFLSQGPFRTFYLDSLQEDIFFNYLENHSQLILERLQEKYNFSVTKDVAVLYCRYIPYIVEKTLYLKKQEGLFQNIAEDDIPYQIFNSTYSGKIPQDVIESCYKTTCSLTPKVMQSISSIPTREELEALNLLPLSLKQL